MICLFRIVLSVCVQGNSSVIIKLGTDGACACPVLWKKSDPMAMQALIKLGIISTPDEIDAKFTVPILFSYPFSYPLLA